MDYRVEFDALDEFNNAIGSHASSWMEELQALDEATNALAVSNNMSGEGAQCIKCYFETIHSTIIGLLAELIQLHSQNCFLYKRDYESNVDSDLHAIIVQEELEDCQERLKASRQGAIDVQEELDYTLGKISDIFYVSYQNVSEVDQSHSNLISSVEELNEQIQDLESGHTSQDFVNSEAAIASIKAFLNELYAKDRGYKSSFATENLSSSQAFRDVFLSYLSITQEIKGKTHLLADEIENENERIALLQEEYEKRQEAAKWEKIAVTGICVIGSAAAIIFTGGAAAPLIAGAVSGAIIAGNNAAADEYVQHGWNMGKWDYAAIGKDAFIGGVTGLVTAYVGGQLGQFLTSTASATSLGSTLLNSSSTFIRAGTGAVIGGSAQIISGIGSRAAGTFVSSFLSNGGNLSVACNDAINAAFDGKQILFDGVSGGVSGGISAAKTPVGKSINKDNLDDFLDSKPSHSPNPEKWLANGGEIKVDANGVWTYIDADGCAVCYTNGVPDFSRSGKVEATYVVEDGFDTSNHSSDINQAIRDTGLGGKGSGMTWHHAPDGKTLQLVPTEFHERFRHVGGFALAKGGHT